MGNLVTIVFPSDVDREKARLDPSFRTTDASVQACAAMSTATRSGWASFYASWRAFADRPTEFFSTAREWDETQKYASDLAGWQAAIKGERCSVVGPAVGGDAGPDLSALKWVAAAAIVVSVVYGARLVLR